MSNIVAKFEKVSFEQYCKDFFDCFPNLEDSQLYRDTYVRVIYDKIELPQRATPGSAGYDFFAPVDISIKSGDTVKIPTGIRCKINDNWYLGIYPRSSLGFKFRAQLDNTVGIIDSDYYGAKNEGHIMVKLTCDSKSDKELNVKMGEAFAQGIFAYYGLAENDAPYKEKREGGFGSTNKENK